ncbi:septum formation family protein [Arthrobacter sp. UYP6]|uniref:septum formation family protein n=1 Tax=Arthrobacter sp. UYP6 TaxID=1756378 RepID=UPI00339B7A2D
MSDKNSTPGAGSPPASGASEAKPKPAQQPAPDTSGSVPEDTSGSVAPVPGLPDLQAHAEPPQWLTGDDGHDVQAWSEAFEAEADAGQEDGTDDVAADHPDEPQLTNPNDVTLEEPSLERPDISSEAAESASLSDAAAEVKAVEAEAADAAVLTDPAANHPAAVNHTAGIAAASPMTGSQPEADQAAEPANPSESTGPAESTEPSKPAESADPAVPAESRRSRRDAEPPAAAAGNGGSGGGKRALLIIGVLGVLAVLVVLLFTVLGSSAKEPGVLDENVAPIDLESGSCLQDFTGVNEPTTVVTCETPHNAQLVATDTYPDSDSFPGTEALSARATEVCSQVRYSDTVTDNPDLELQENKVIPTQESWNDGDRRIDCFVVSSGDRDLTASLLQE